VYDEDGPPSGRRDSRPLCGDAKPLDAGLETTPARVLSAMLGMSDDDNVVDRAVFGALAIARSDHAPGLRVGRPRRSTWPTDRAVCHEYTYAFARRMPGRTRSPPARIEALNQPNYVATEPLATLIVEP